MLMKDQKKLGFCYYPYKATRDFLHRRKIYFRAQTAKYHYKKVIKNIKESGNKVLNFGAYVIFDSTFGLDLLFSRMINDEHWNPMIVVIPDISRGLDHAKSVYQTTKDFFIGKYGDKYVIDGWNIETGEYIDNLSKFNIVYYANPYDFMVHNLHSIQYASKQNVLPFYVSYGFYIGSLTCNGLYTSIEHNILWKYFTDTTYSYNDCKKYMINHGDNVVLSGYSKMDEFIPSHEKKQRRKILISTHHTVSREDIPLSNFLSFYGLIPKLAKIFPQVDFVFRPHPLLFVTLINNNLWTKDMVDSYLAELTENGIEYSTGGGYLDIFAECDAIINDCGSFTVEWLYTGKPGCFVYSDRLNPSLLTPLMNNCLEKYTIAKNEEDIISFVNQVLMSPAKERYPMDDWVRNNIAINYPDVTGKILEEIDISCHKL